jgi:hypothetical protein
MAWVANKGDHRKRQAMCFARLVQQGISDIGPPRGHVAGPCQENGLPPKGWPLSELLVEDTQIITAMRLLADPSGAAGVATILCCSNLTGEQVKTWLD